MQSSCRFLSAPFLNYVGSFLSDACNPFFESDTSFERAPKPTMIYIGIWWEAKLKIQRFKCDEMIITVRDCDIFKLNLTQ
jgi:hypothetical protein